MRRIATVFVVLGLSFLLMRVSLASEATFELIDSFDCGTSWEPAEVVERASFQSDPEIVQEGKGCMKLLFSVAKLDIGRDMFLRVVKSGFRINPPERFRLMVRSESNIPLYFRAMDESGSLATWLMKNLPKGKWQRVVLEMKDADILNPTGAGGEKAGLRAPICWMSFAVRCTDVVKPGRYQFFVDCLEGQWEEGSPVPQPREPLVTDMLEKRDGWQLHGCDVEQTEWRGRRCLKVTFKADADFPWLWLTRDMRMSRPSSISFWIYPTGRVLLIVNALDWDGTQAQWKLMGLTARRWQRVRLSLDEAGKWATKPFQPTLTPDRFFNMPLRKISIVTQRDELRGRDVVCYLGGLEFTYEAEVYLDRAAGVDEFSLDREMFSDGEWLTARAPLKQNQPSRFTTRWKVVSADDGEEIISIKRAMSREGDGCVAFRLNASGLPVGRYVLAVKTVSNGRVLFEGEREFERVDVAARIRYFEAQARELENSANEIAELIDNAQSRCSYQRLALATLRRFVPLSLEFCREGKFDRTERDYRFLRRLSDSTKVELRRILSGEAKPLNVEPEKSDRLELKGGNIVAGGKPVVLFGPLGKEAGERLDLARDFGFNFIDAWDTWANCMRVVLKSDEKLNTAGFEDLRLSWEKARRAGLYMIFCPALRFPYWAYEKYPDTAGYGGVGTGVHPVWRHAIGPKNCGGGFWHFCMEAPNSKRLVAWYYAALIPKVAQLPPPRFYWLMNEPTYRSETPIYLKLFREEMKRRYKTIDALNEMWGTSYGNFDEINFPKKEKKAAWFDWMDFHHRQVSDWFRWLYAELKRHDPDALVTNKPLSVSMFRPRYGISLEEQARIFDIAGCDTSRSYRSGAEFAFDSPFGGEWSASAVMALDLFKSVAPDKPVADTEYHYAHSANVAWYPENYVRAAFFQSYFHGLRLCIFWIWAKTYRQGWAGVQYPPFARANVAWATGKTALDLRRLAEYVCRFPAPKPEVRLLYSRTCMFLDTKRYSKALMDAYKALYFLDAPIGFVTERMVREGKLRDGAKVLICPAVDYLPDDVYEGIREFRKSGGLVVLTHGTALDRDEHGKPRDRVLSAERLDAVDIRELSIALDELLSHAGVNRPARVVEMNGDNAWGVESRTVECDDAALTYLINLTERRRFIGITGKYERGIDLLANRSIASKKIELEPLGVMLIKWER